MVVITLTNETTPMNLREFDLQSFRWYKYNENSALKSKQQRSYRQHQ
jgi:hypothetical protein